jgi:hypothetical protein
VHHRDEIRRNYINNGWRLTGDGCVVKILKRGMDVFGISNSIGTHYYYTEDFTETRSDKYKKGHFTSIRLKVFWVSNTQLQGQYVTISLIKGMLKNALVAPLGTGWMIYKRTHCRSTRPGNYP